MHEMMKEHFMSAEEAWERFYAENRKNPVHEDYLNFMEMYGDYVAHFEKYADGRSVKPAISLFWGTGLKDAKYETVHNKWTCGVHKC